LERKFYKKLFHNFYFSPNVHSGKLRWERELLEKGVVKCIRYLWLDMYMKEIDCFENLGIVGRRISKQIINKHGAIMGVAFICLRFMTVDGLL
jgi:hypothetical protein